MQHYGDLQALIFQDADARQYYNELPEYVREMIHERGGDVNSFDSLKSHADRLLRGDD
ncbi:MAG: hypothetical protein FWF44_05390 [Defluviitaleaceae bacterium]|nr:hypothetical protein [Defluviitaleaceae bacterium]